MNRPSTWTRILLALLFLCAAPAMADDYLVYTDAGIPAGGSDIWTWCGRGQPCDFAQVRTCANPEGSLFIRQREVPASDPGYAGFGVFHNIDPGADGARDAWCAGPGDPFTCCTGPGTGFCSFDDFATPVDLSAFMGGEVRAWVKTNLDLNLEMQCEVGGANKTGFLQLSATNWDGAATWQEVVFPISAYDFGNPPINMAECLSNVISPWMSTAASLKVTLNEFQIDNVRWHKPNAHAGPSSVQISGRQLLVDGEPFVIRGMAYSPISIGEDFHGALRDRPDRYLVDFPLIKASGANTVRIYSSFLTTAMLDAAWANGLYVIPTYPVDWAQLTCAQGEAFMQDHFVAMVNQWKNHPAILLWLVGNEVNVNLGGTLTVCGDFYPQLDAMAAAAHAAEGATFHPVGTANADTNFADICEPGCSDDTTLPNVDFWGLQIYRGCSFAGAFDQYAARADCSRPLVVTEFGADSWDSLSGASGAVNETMQAECLGSLLGEAEQALALRNPSGVLAGQVIFSWADEWWKAYALDPEVEGFCSAADNTSWTSHDTCKGWESFGYPDPAMNEEWWGIVGVDAADPNARTLRAAETTVGEKWHLGNACNMTVVTYDPATENTTLSFEPAPGSTDHTLYYGPLAAATSYGYTGSLSQLGPDGSSAVTLPAGDLFWLVVGRNGDAEGGYGTGLVERPPFGGAAVPQDPNRTGLCSTP